jgi:hypothetical protein
VDSDSQTYTYNFYFYPNSLFTFYADRPGRHVLSFFVDGKLSNQVVIDVTGTYIPNNYLPNYYPYYDYGNYPIVSGNQGGSSGSGDGNNGGSGGSSDGNNGGSSGSSDGNNGGSSGSGDGNNGGSSGSGEGDHVRSDKTDR